MNKAASRKPGLPQGSPFHARQLLRAGLAVCLVATAQAQPGPLQGPHQISLHGPQGQKLVIGQVLFTPTAQGPVKFVVTIDHTRFTDHFLSMREMKCLPGGTEILCHIPYPYAQPGTVTGSDFAWLEHNLLFMFKKPADFGAKLWNGVYYQLRRTEQGLEGRPQAVDLNVIAAPTTTPDLAPYRKALRDDMAEGARWFHRLTIEP